jgi:hypothetical protein
MTTLSMHAASAPAFAAILRSMRTWLGFALEDAAARKYEPSVLLGMRLAPDMLPLAKQVQIACDMAKFCLARLSGQEAPAHADDETTVEQLQARLAAVADWIESVPASAVDGTEAKPITLKLRQGETTMPGLNYLRDFATPNVYFHATTTYALLRHAGVELGKADFLGRPRTPA